MTKRISAGEIIALRPGHGRVGDPLDVVVPVRADTPLADNDTAADFGNVVPFARPRGHARTAPAVALPTDVAWVAQPRSVRERAGFAALVTLSVAAHAGLFVALWREPTPLASIGLEVISVELVLGATAPAGVATTQGEQQVQTAAAPETEAVETENANEKATAQPQNVEVARQETAPEGKTEQPNASEARLEHPKSDTAAAREEPAQTEPDPTVAMLEMPSPDIATAKRQETPPPAPAVTLPRPREKAVKKNTKLKPAHATPPKPMKEAKSAKDAHRIAAPTRE